MINKIKVLFAAVVIAVVTGNSVNAQQTVKLGHVNSQEILQVFPDRINAEKAMQEYAKKLETEQKRMEDELNKKYQEYLVQRDSLAELVKATKEKDLQELQQRIATYSQIAQQDLQKKEEEMIKPIIEKVQKAIDEVGKENGFTYIMDVANRTVVYVGTGSTDITSLVKKKLGME